MFRFPADRIPVAIILAITCADFYLYFEVESTTLLVCYWLLLAFPKLQICAWNHHHQHTRTFHSTALNRLLEFFYALHTGVTTNLWLLHHVLGHHHNYLDQTQDESRWKRDSGEQMGEWEYTFKVAMTAYYRGYQVGKRHPRAQREFLVYSVLTFSIVAALTWFNPVASLLLFVLPMIVGLVLTSWVTYDHHAGLDSDNVFAASYSNVGRVYNLLTGNLGYHAAHHYKQGVHWSKLPQLHEQIKDRIPPELIQGATATA
ncbi:MAG: fatty acid desaturase [Halioglobus sp.]